MPLPQRPRGNVGRLHAVKCDWCGLKMSCCCLMDDSRDSANGSHLAVLCPRCQVTEVLNEMFSGGDKDEGAQTDNGKMEEQGEECERNR